MTQPFTFTFARHVGSRLAAVGLAAAVLAGCGAPPPAPEDKFYRLNVTAAQPGPRVLDGVVEVDRFAASGALANRPLLFAEPGANAVSEFHYHFWMEAPPILLQGALVSYLRSAKVAERVVTPEMRVDPDYTVMGRVMRLEIVRGGSSSAGAVSLELALRRESDGELVVLGEYTAEVPSNTDGIQTDVAAVDQAVDDAFAQFAADIRQALSEN